MEKPKKEKNHLGILVNKTDLCRGGGGKLRVVLPSIEIKVRLYAVELSNSKTIIDTKGVVIIFVQKGKHFKFRFRTFVLSSKILSLLTFGQGVGDGHFSIFLVRKKNPIIITTDEDFITFDLTKLWQFVSLKK